MASEPELGSPEVDLVALAVMPPALSPDDSAATAVAQLRASGASALPVVQDGHPVGLFGERQVVAVYAGRGDAALSVGRVMADVTALPQSAPVADAVAMLQRPEIEALVITLEGRYRGLVTRAQILAQSMGNETAPRIGGLATPIGVYLTDGYHRGGRGDLALVLTGAYLATMLLAARWLAAIVLAALSADPQAAYWSILGGPASTPESVWSAWLPLPFFAMLLRLSPVAGFHAAEHQAVHLVEAGLPLTAEHAQRMPRVHMRCGTNLAVLLGLLGGVGLVATGHASAWWLVPLGVGLWQRLRLGSWAQQFITTKAPTLAQSEAGVNAARLLLSRRRARPVVAQSGWHRFMRRGVLQLAAGAVAAWVAVPWLTTTLTGWIIGP